MFAGYNIGAFRSPITIQSECLRLIPDLDTPQSYAEQASQRDFGTRAYAPEGGVAELRQTWSSERLEATSSIVGASNRSSVVQMGSLMVAAMCLRPTADMGPKALTDALRTGKSQKGGIMGPPNVFPGRIWQAKQPSACHPRPVKRPARWRSGRRDGVVLGRQNKPEYQGAACCQCRSPAAWIHGNQHPARQVELLGACPGKPGWINATPGVLLST